MANLAARTVVLYLLVVFLMRLCGKRQAGQLELPELVTAFMLGQLASYPLADNEIPLLYGVVPSVVLVCVEVILSYAAIKLTGVRRLFSGRSLTLIRAGEPDIRAFVDTRVTVEEVMSAARMAGIGRFADINYAFLECGGNISVLPKKDGAAVDHPVVLDGQIDGSVLRQLGKTKQDILTELYRRQYGLKEVLYMGIDDAGEITVIGKAKK